MSSCASRNPTDTTNIIGDKLTFTEGAALIILKAPKRANAAGAAFVLDKALFAAIDRTEEGKRIILIVIEK